MPRINIIIPAFNCATYLAEAVEGVLAQTYQDFDLIFVDDGSTDKTRRVLEPYLDRIRHEAAILTVHGVGEWAIATLGKAMADWDGVTTQRNQHYADIAASIPRVTEQTVRKISNCAHERTGPKKLCIVREAPNSVANGRILRESPSVALRPSTDLRFGIGDWAVYLHTVLNCGHVHT